MTPRLAYYICTSAEQPSYFARVAQDSSHQPPVVFVVSDPTSQPCKGWHATNIHQLKAALSVTGVLQQPLFTTAELALQEASQVGTFVISEGAAWRQLYAAGEQPILLVCETDGTHYLDHTKTYSDQWLQSQHARASPAPTSQPALSVRSDRNELPIARDEPENDQMDSPDAVEGAQEAACLAGEGAEPELTGSGFAEDLKKVMTDEQNASSEEELAITKRYLMDTFRLEVTLAGWVCFEIPRPHPQKGVDRYYVPPDAQTLRALRSRPDVARYFDQEVPGGSQGCIKASGSAVASKLARFATANVTQGAALCVVRVQGQQTIDADYLGNFMGSDWFRTAGDPCVRTGTQIEEMACFASPPKKYRSTMHIMLPAKWAGRPFGSVFVVLEQNKRGKRAREA